MPSASNIESCADRAALTAFIAIAVETAPSAFALCPDEIALPEIQEDLFGGNSSWFVARDTQGAIVGCMRLKRRGLAKLRHKAEITTLFVAPTHRRAGLAAALLNAAIAAARADVTSLRIFVGTDLHAAIALYLRQGFRIYACEPAARREADGPQDEYIMELALA